MFLEIICVNNKEFKGGVIQDKDYVLGFDELIIEKTNDV